MRHFYLMLSLAVLLVVTGAGVSRLSAQEASPVVDADELILVERNELTETVDLGDPGVSAGDILVWGPNPLYGAANETDTGATMAGECITLTSDGIQHCSMTFTFPDGSLLTAQGIQLEGAPSQVVITGGTGLYLGATGRLTSEPSADLEQYTHTIEFDR